MVGLKGEVGSKNHVSEKISTSHKPKECEGVTSQIPPMYIDDVATSYVEDIEPLLLNLVVNGKVVKTAWLT